MTQPGLPDAISHKTTAATIAPIDLRDDVGDDVLVGAAPGAPQAERDRRVEVTARDVTDGIGHGQHGQAEREGDAEKADPEVRESQQPRRPRRSRPRPARAYRRTRRRPAASCRCPSVPSRR